MPEIIRFENAKAEPVTRQIIEKQTHYGATYALVSHSDSLDETEQDRIVRISLPSLTKNGNYGYSGVLVPHLSRIQLYLEARQDLQARYEDDFSTALLSGDYERATRIQNTYLVAFPSAYFGLVADLQATMLMIFWR